MVKCKLLDHVPLVEVTMPYPGLLCYNNKLYELDKDIMDIFHIENLYEINISEKDDALYVMFFVDEDGTVNEGWNDRWKPDSKSMMEVFKIYQEKHDLYLEKMKKIADQKLMIEDAPQSIMMMMDGEQQKKIADQKLMIEDAPQSIMMMDGEQQKKKESLSEERDALVALNPSLVSMAKDFAMVEANGVDKKRKSEEEDDDEDMKLMMRKRKERKTNLFMQTMLGAMELMNMHMEDLDDA